MLQDKDATRKVKGQLLYMPVYSNVPYHIVGIEEFDMSAFVAVHNTDINYTITITNSVFYDKNGRPVFDFLTEREIVIDLPAAKDFQILHVNEI